MKTLLAASLLALSSSAAFAAESTSLIPSLTDAYRADPEQPTSSDSSHPTTSDSPAFAEPGWWGLEILTGYANNFKGESDINLAIAVGTFVAQDLEIRLELGGWYFAQRGDDTGGISLSLLGRWHFWECNNYDWTVYGEAGAGLLGSFDNVPDGGTSFNFTPRLGGGFTKRLGDGPRAPRLDVGARWHHISNARIDGDDRNPSRDSVMGYIGVIFSF